MNTKKLVPIDFYGLASKVIIVTGGSGALGESIVQRLADLGCHVYFTYNSNSTNAQRLESLSTSGKIKAKKVRVGFADEVKAFSDWVSSEEKEIYGLINNIGLSEFYPFPLLETKEWDLGLSANLSSAYHFTQSIVRHMIRNKSGSVLNIGSLAGTKTIRAPIQYCSAKAGLIGFTQSLGKELGRYNIRVNCLSPGIIEGGVSHNIPEQNMNQYREHICLQRIGMPLEVAESCAMLMSPRNGFMTTSTLCIDGGF